MGHAPRGVIAAASGGAARLTYDGGFIEHDVGSLGYPQGMPRRLEWIAGFSVVIWNALVYAAVLVFADVA